MFIRRKEYNKLKDDCNHFSRKNDELQSRIDFCMNQLDASAEENMKLINNYTKLLNLYGTKADLAKIPYHIEVADNVYRVDFGAPKYYQITIPSITFHVTEKDAKEMNLLD